MIDLVKEFESTEAKIKMVKRAMRILMSSNVTPVMVGINEKPADNLIPHPDYVGKVFLEKRCFVDKSSWEKSESMKVEHFHLLEEKMHLEGKLDSLSVEFANQLK